MTLQRRQDELFWDEVDGGWFSTTGRDKNVLLRMKEDYDGAEPTASSVSVINLLTLTHSEDSDDRVDESDPAGRFDITARDSSRLAGRADDGRGVGDVYRGTASGDHGGRGRKAGRPDGPTGNA